jgi:histone demethylase JARID1
LFFCFLRIRSEAEHYGICKIVPPEGWNPPQMLSFNSSKQFPTRKQSVNTLQEGQGFDDGKKYTIAEYKKMADEFAKNWQETHHSGKDADLEVLCKDYWDLVETNSRSVTVEYGNDIDTSVYGSGFPSKSLKQEIKESKNTHDNYMNDPDYYSKTGWNTNIIPSAPGSLLSRVKTPINGINVPWLYLGMLFSTFCWPTEDNYFYSISYHHFGSEKQWYGVPAEDAERFEKMNIPSK